MTEKIVHIKPHSRRVPHAAAQAETRALLEGFVFWKRFEQELSAAFDAQFEGEDEFVRRVRETY